MSRFIHRQYKYQFVAISAFLLLLGAGCAGQTYYQAPAPTTTVAAPGNTTITYYVSAAKSAVYCNGADMDSAGYKKSINIEVTRDLNVKLNLQDQIIKTLQMAAADTEFNGSDDYTRLASTTYNNGVVTLYPASGWAGVSIFNCAWQPFVQKQLEQFPEVKKVEWSAVSN